MEVALLHLVPTTNHVSSFQSLPTFSHSIGKSLDSSSVKAPSEVSQSPPGSAPAIFSTKLTDILGCARRGSGPSAVPDSEAAAHSTQSPPQTPIMPTRFTDLVSSVGRTPVPQPQTESPSSRSSAPPPQTSSPPPPPPSVSVQSEYIVTVMHFHKYPLDRSGAFIKAEATVRDFRSGLQCQIDKEKPKDMLRPLSSSKVEQEAVKGGRERARGNEK
ncbi:uncharacterized protein [Garra rufa]|uniref:uncharacterized protein n=1 Tax=Garra rufa TaxID=137080 RepID=UPI003CCE746B